MGKTHKKRIEEEYDDFSYEEQKQNDIDKRKKKRVARALRIKDLDVLLDEDLDWDGYQ